MSKSGNTTFKIGHEYLLPNEDVIIQQMVDEMQDEMVRLYKEEGKIMPRQVHTKMHGCVKGIFKIDPNLDPKYRVGVFKEARDYNCWIRFSNANLPPQPDKKKDIRGIAIKLMGVPGEKILNSKRHAKTHDFLLMSSETFFSRNIVQFAPLLTAATSENPKKLMIKYAITHLRLIFRLLKSRIKCDNLLNIPYWSTQPYRFGTPDKAVKYFLKPSEDNVIINENLEEDDYLRRNLSQTLNNHSAEFDFYVQFQTDADEMPIEDPVVPWTSDFHKLATLVIPAQEIDSNKQIRFGEDLSFNAWHALPEHRPLGNFNRARKRAYDAMSKFRHEYNDRPDKEPEDSVDFLQGTRIPSENVIPQEISRKGVIHMQADVLVDCSKKIAFEFISSGAELPNWLKKFGKIPQALNAVNISSSYNTAGDQRIVHFDGGESVHEELITFNPSANYSYKVTKFSSIFKKFSDEAYSIMWFDTIDDKTRISWEYMYTAKNFFARIILKFVLRLIKYEEFMQQSLDNAKDYIENGD
ncbi:MAG: hypothetical protein OEQ81_08495 [Flavobacteriaceae bacterium]|nr:hypothetical protein [Flavobacteriaceae bacterium]